VTLSKTELLAPRLGEGEHEIAGVGTVRIRGLSRAEVLEMRNLEGGAIATDRRMLSLAMLDPTLTEDEVAAWQRTSNPDEIEKLTLAIADLSGMGDGANKAAYKSVRE
jgi:hypothetical protein